MVISHDDEWNYPPVQKKNPSEYHFLGANHREMLWPLVLDLLVVSCLLSWWLLDYMKHYFDPVGFFLPFMHSECANVQFKNLLSEC